MDFFPKVLAFFLEEFFLDILKAIGRSGFSSVQRKGCWESAEKGMLKEYRERDAGKVQRKV